MSGYGVGVDRIRETPRLSGLTSWDADWAGLRVVVAGIGASGFSAADTLIELGAVVVVVDAGTTAENEAKADTLRIVGARDVLLGGEHVTTLPLVDGDEPELVVTSPGWRPTQPLLAAAAVAGVPIWGDVELAWRVRERAGRRTAEWVTITGTNGKTTTVGLTESMLRAGGKRVFKMAPLQHHFELKGWAEVTVVVRFWILAGLFVAGALGIFYAEWVVG